MYLQFKAFCSKAFSFFMKGTTGGLNGLFINYVDYFHAGQYECIAQTTITQTSVTTNVIVRGIYQSHLQHSYPPPPPPPPHTHT